MEDITSSENQTAADKVQSLQNLGLSDEFLEEVNIYSIYLDIQLFGFEHNILATNQKIEEKC